MIDKKYPLSREEFEAIYAKVPRLTVELIIKNADGAVYLTKRAPSVPCPGKWNLPGGTMFFGESVEQAVKRVGLKELSIEILGTTHKGYIEYPSHYLNGVDEPVGLVFEITRYQGEPTIDNEAASGGWFTALPENMHADVDEYLVKNDYLSR
jgi:ADP-ribose pyrophosphatase YjhB (NUDIX family)